MNQNNLRIRLLVTPLLAGALLLVCDGVRAEESCVSDRCHAKLLKGKTVHPVAETCESCHESVAAPHPAKGKKTFKLTQNQPDLCYGCHDAFGKKATVHPAVKLWPCTTCHNPHSSDEPKLLVSPMKGLCGTCHADHVDFKVVHGPVSAGDCTACHTPHESDAKTLLVKKDDELCFGCHLDIQELLKKKDVHPAAQMGCTSCHDPHGGPYRKLLAKEGPQLCYSCHADVEGKVAKSPVAHAAVQAAGGCASCHSPHASDNPKLLAKSEKETCLDCHKTVITKGMKVLHGPIQEGRCTPCHEPHGGANANLLVKGFPPDPYVPYTDTAFALCFGCHKRDLLQYPETSFATKFRDGERNLHYLHVNDKLKGRSCKLCHEIHGSAGPKLIAESVPFGKWNLPLKFVKTETGGGCSPGCHKQAYYDRETPGKKPPPPSKPAGDRG